MCVSLDDAPGKGSDPEPDPKPFPRTEIITEIKGRSDVRHVHQGGLVDPPGCWVAYNGDGSAFVPFSTELEALRYAVGNGGMLQVKFAQFGDEDWMKHDVRPSPSIANCR